MCRKAGFTRQLYVAAFIPTFCSYPVAVTNASRFARWVGTNQQSALVLAQHVQAAVAQVEDFITVLHDTSAQSQLPPRLAMLVGMTPFGQTHSERSGASDSAGGALRLLGRPFRLRLVRGASLTFLLRRVPLCSDGVTCRRRR